MKKVLNSLNEEMNRIKSLFTEERMFGNLVEQEGEDEEEDSDDVNPFDCAVEATGLKPTKDNLGRDHIVYIDTDGTKYTFIRETVNIVYIGDWDPKTRLWANESYDCDSDILKRAKIRKSKGEIKTTPKSTEDKTEPKSTESSETLDERGCIQFIKKTYKDTVKVGSYYTRPAWKKTEEGSSIVKQIEYCLTTYGKKFTKEGIFRAGDEASKLIEILKLEIPKYEENKNVDRNIEVKDKYGKVIMIIKNIDENADKYEFRSKLGSDLFNNVKSGGLGKRKYFDPQVEDKIRQTMNLDSSKTITIEKGMNVKGFDSGTFRIT